MIHQFICDSCGNSITDTSAKAVHVCACGKNMRWDLKGIGIPLGDYNHTSDSLAIHPADIPEHRKLYPGIEVTPEGQPKFTSMRQQEKYAVKSAGCYKKRQCTHTLGRQRIA